MNKDKIPCKLVLYYKTSKSIDIKKKEVIIESPKQKSVIEIVFSSREIKNDGAPDLWWVEVLDLSDGKLLNEAGVGDYEKIKERLKLMHPGKVEK